MSFESPKVRSERRKARRRTVITGLRGAVLAVSAMILCWNLTVGAGLVAAAVGAAFARPRAIGSDARRSAFPPACCSPPWL